MSDSFRKMKKYITKFVYHHGQKPSLTYNTVPIVSTALFHIYPLLLIWDCILSKIMWIQEDTCLRFIHLVLSYTSLFLLQLDSEQTAWKDQVFSVWIGFLSFGFLILSIVYYINTLVKEFTISEPPTVDDIVIVLESVLDKLDKIREEILGIGLNKRTTTGFIIIFKLLLIMTPIHWIIMKWIFTPRDYIIWLIITLSLYHSSWFQCTLKLCWRSLIIRRLYYKFWLSTFWKRESPPFFRIISQNEIKLPSKSLYGLSKRDIHLELLNSNQIDTKKITHENSDKYVFIDIVEFLIDENERKWQTDGWSHILLPYERQKYSNTLDKFHTRCNSPWNFQEELSPRWLWIDEQWKPSSWNYCDTEWNFLGKNDSVDSYTRRRTWKRRAFQIKEGDS